MYTDFFKDYGNPAIYSMYYQYYFCIKLFYILESRVLIWQFQLVANKILLNLNHLMI